MTAKRLIRATIVLCALLPARCGDGNDETKSAAPTCPEGFKYAPPGDYANCIEYRKQRCACASLPEDEQKACAYASNEGGYACLSNDTDITEADGLCRDILSSQKDVCNVGVICGKGTRAISIDEEPNCKVFHENRCKCPNLDQASKSYCDAIARTGQTCIATHITPQVEDDNCKKLVDAASHGANFCPQ